MRESDYFGKPKREFISLEPADDSLFSDDELDIVNQVIRVVCGEHTATSISDLSHDVIWEAAEMFSFSFFGLGAGFEKTKVMNNFSLLKKTLRRIDGC